MALIKTYESYIKIIKNHEVNILNSDLLTANQAYLMTEFLNQTLKDLKNEVSLNGFSCIEEEICFFKTIKPEILGKLIFYNKVYRLETNSPNDSNIKYYCKKLQELESEYKRHQNNSEFYRYYQANREDKDSEYFTLGNINLKNGVNSFAFEIDPQFSTYYDYKVARIQSYNHLYQYLNRKITNNDIIFSDRIDQITWSETQNDLIELIYALHANRSINGGKIEIRKISIFFQQSFGINLTDIHHAFHRMKTRTTSRTIFLDKLKKSLEDYMDNDI